MENIPTTGARYSAPDKTKRLIDTIRSVYGATYADIAKELGISERTVQYWATGQRGMSSLYGRALVRRMREGTLALDRNNNIEFTKPEPTAGQQVVRSFLAKYNAKPKHLAKVLGITDRSVHYWLRNSRPVPESIQRYLQVTFLDESQTTTQSILNYFVSNHELDKHKLANLTGVRRERWSSLLRGNDGVTDGCKRRLWNWLIEQ